jgi:hypothetical protein
MEPNYGLCGLTTFHNGDIVGGKLPRRGALLVGDFRNKAQSFRSPLNRTGESRCSAPYGSLWPRYAWIVRVLTPFIGHLEPAGVPQHVRMDREAKLGALAQPLDHLLEAVDRDRCFALRCARVEVRRVGAWSSSVGLRVDPGPLASADRNYKKDPAAPTGSVVRPRRVSPCISWPPVRRDAGAGAVLTHEVQGQRTPTRAICQRSGMRSPAIHRF